MADSLGGESRCFANLVLEQRLDEGLLVRKASINGTDAEAGTVGNVVEGRFQTLLSKYLGRGLQRSLTVTHSVCPKPGRIWTGITVVWVRHQNQSSSSSLFWLLALRIRSCYAPMWS